ncbi:MAG: 6-pyruvoyl trahydropterin synthase family protein [Spirochaetaceae bacterium]
MYTLTVRRDFVAQHFLIGGDWGAENSPHSHHYRMELTLEGADLDRHGYLVDIVEIEAVLNATVDEYRDRLLNEIPAFQSLNPSLERFCRHLAERIDASIEAPTVSALTVLLWENEIASASFRLDRPAAT